METMMVASDVNLNIALKEAFLGYFIKKQRIPNRVIVREGTEMADIIEFEYELHKGKIIHVKAIVEKVKWLRKGDVGVYCKNTGVGRSERLLGVISENGGLQIGSGGAMEMQEWACARGGGADGEGCGESAALSGGIG